MEKFLKGCAAPGGRTRGRRKKIWDAMEQFAGYGFNKSHSAAYALARLPDRVPQGELPGVLHGGAAHVGAGEHRQDGAVHRRVPRDGHPRAAARREPVGHVLHRRGRRAAVEGRSADDLATASAAADTQQAASAAGFTPAERAGSGRLVRRSWTTPCSAAGEQRLAAQPPRRDVGSASPRSRTSARARSRRSLGVRRASGAFSSLYDFCDRVDLRAVNRRVVESFVKSGCFDSMDPRRSALFAAIDRAIGRRAEAPARPRGRASRASSGCSAAGRRGRPPSSASPTRRPGPKAERLAFEKESLGFFISGHPLERYRAELAQWATHDRGHPGPGRGRRPRSRSGGIVTALRLIKTKKGDRMASFVLEDLDGSVETLVFPETYKKTAGRLADDVVVLVKGRAEIQDDGKARAARLRRAAARPGQARRGPLRHDPRAPAGVGPRQGRAPARHPRPAPRRLPGDARAHPTRLVGRRSRPERVLPRAARARAAATRSRRCSARAPSC